MKTIPGERFNGRTGGGALYDLCDLGNGKVLDTHD